MGVSTNATPTLHREELQTFILRLNERLRPMTDADEVQREAMRSLGEQLAVNRAFYGEVLADEDTLVVGPGHFRDVPPLPARIKISSYHDEMRCPLQEGRTVAVGDVFEEVKATAEQKALYGAIGMRSGVGVPLIKRGKLAAIVSVHHASPREWAPEEVSLIEAVAERTWMAVEQAKAEESLRHSGSRLKLAMAKSRMGTFVWFVEEDRSEPDAKMLELFGVRRGGELNLGNALAEMIHPDDRESYAEAVGCAVDPAGDGTLQEEFRVVHQDGSIHWIGIMGRTIFEGYPRRATMMHGMAVDVTERKHAEERIRESQDRQAFLLKLSDALRPLSDPNEVQAATCRALGGHLAVSRAFYCEVDDEAYILDAQFAQGVEPLPPGRYPIDSFGDPVIADYRAGRTVAMADTQTDPRLPEDVSAAWAGVQCRGVVGVPLVKNGQLVAVLGIHNAEARAWATEEIALIEETAERTWAAVERARAEETVRQSAEALSTLIERSPYGVYVIDAEFRLTQMNRGSRDGAFANVRPLVGRPFDEVMRTIWPEPLATELIGIFRHTMETGEPYRSKDFVNPREDVERVESYEWELHRIAMPDGQFGIVCYYYDSTELRAAEMQVRESEERLRIASEAAHMYTWETDLATQETWVSDNLAAVTGLDFNLPSMDLAACMQETFHAEDREALQRYLADKVAGTAAPSFEVRLRDPSGENRVVWVEISCDVSRDASGQPLRLVGVGQNITERKRREANLAFLGEISEEMVRLESVDKTMGTVTRRVADHFGLGHTLIFEIDEAQENVEIRHGWHRPDLPEIAGTFRIADFVSPRFATRSRAGETIVVRDLTDDTVSDPESFVSLGIRSFVAVSLIRDGSWRFTLGIYAPETRDWREDEIELMRELTTRIWTRLERARTEEALRESEEKYRTLFEAIDEGFVEFEVIMSADGRALDWRYLACNSAFERLSGLKDITGRLMSEVIPDLEPHWGERFAQVVTTGEAMRFELPAAGIDRWFDVYVARLGGDGSRRLAVAYNNSTERKRAEANLAFLAEVSSDLVHLTNIDETMEALGVKIGAHFLASICSFLEIDAEGGIGTVTHGWHAEDAVSLVGEYRIADYGTEEQLATWSSGKPFVVRDAKSDERVYGDALGSYGIGSYISIPIARDGEWRFLLSVYDRAARDWREDEIELMHEITTRIWTRVERARAEEALARSEGKYRVLFESMDEGFCVIEFFDGPHGPLSDYVHVEANPAYTANAGIPDIVGQKVREMVPDEAEGWVEIYRNVLLTGESVRFERELVATGRHLELAAFRVEPPESRQVAVLFRDVTERRRAGEILRQNNEELGRFNELMVGRELRMIELKEEINELSRGHGEADRYLLKFEQKKGQRQGDDE